MNKWLAVAVVMLMGLVGGIAHAFSLSPLHYLVTVDPGSKETVPVTVLNDASQDKIFHVFTVSLQKNTDGGVVMLSDTDVAQAWVRSEVDNVYVRAGEKKEVVFNIAPPREAAPGAHYLGLAFEPVEEVEGEVGLKARLATVLTLQIAGKVQEDLRVEHWRSDEAYIWRGGAWGFDWELKNVGSIEVNTKARMIVRDWRERTVVEMPLLQNEVILAGGTRQGQYILSAAARPFWPGRYQAEFLIDYGRTEQSTRAFATIWYWPWWILLVPAAAIIILLIIIIKRRK